MGEIAKKHNTICQTQFVFLKESHTQTKHQTVTKRFLRNDKTGWELSEKINTKRHKLAHTAYHTQLVSLKASQTNKNTKLQPEDSYGMTKLGGN